MFRFPLPAPSTSPSTPTWALGLALFLLMGLAACGGGGSDAPADEQQEEELPEQQPPAKPSSFIAVDPGPGFDYLLGMDAFPDGSTVVCGWFPNDHTWEAGKATETMRSALGANDGYVARYDPDGNLLWVQLIIGTDFVVADEVVALPDGSCVVMGWTRDFGILAPGARGQQATASGQPTSFVARYLVDGTLDWVRLIAGVEIDARDGCLFPDGSVGFCGRVLSSAVFGAGEPGATDLTGMTNEGITDFVVRYRASGDLVYAVAPSAGTGGITHATGLAALPDGSAIVAGYFAGTATFGTGTASERTFTGTGFDDGYVVRLDASGGQLWARQLAGAGRELPTDADRLPNGTVAIVGAFTDATLTLNAGEAAPRTITGSSEGNTWLCRYDADGNVVWSTHIEYGVGAFLNTAGVVAFPDNSLAYLAFGPELVTVDPGGANEVALPAFDGSDLLIAKYGADGTLLWARRDGGMGTIARGEGVAAYPDGAIGFAGGFQTEFTVDQGGPGETTYPGYSGQLPGTDTLLVRYNADGSHDGR
jgi:hypothetical protein